MKKITNAEAVTANNIEYQFTAIPTNLFYLLDNNCRSTLFTLVQANSYFTKEDGYFYITKQAIQELTGLSLNVVTATLDTLYINKIISIRTVGKSKGKYVNHYKVNINLFKEYENLSIEELKNPLNKIHTVNYKNNYQPQYIKDYLECANDEARKKVITTNDEARKKVITTNDEARKKVITKDGECKQVRKEVRKKVITNIDNIYNINNKYNININNILYNNYLRNILYKNKKLINNILEDFSKKVERAKQVEIIPTIEEKQEQPQAEIIPTIEDSIKYKKRFNCNFFKAFERLELSESSKEFNTKKEQLEKWLVDHVKTLYSYNLLTSEEIDAIQNTYNEKLEQAEKAVTIKIFNKTQEQAEEEAKQYDSYLNVFFSNAEQTPITA